MNISGIRPVSGFYDYGKTDRILPEAQEAQQEEKIAENENTAEEAAQTFGAYDYVKQYDPDQVYSLKGEDSDIRSRDVQKAISDMQKDQVIRQYHYFVGSALEAQSRGASPVRVMEDFTL